MIVFQTGAARFGLCEMFDYGIGWGVVIIVRALFFFRRGSTFLEGRGTSDGRVTRVVDYYLTLTFSRFSWQCVYSICV